MKAEISDLVAGCSVYEEVKVIVDDWMDYYNHRLSQAGFLDTSKNQDCP